MFNKSFHFSIAKRLFKILFLGSSFTFLISHNALAAEQPPEFSITQANQFVTTGEMRPSTTADHDDSVLIFAYKVDDKIFRLELTVNTRLTKVLSTRSFPEDVKLYSGKIAGNENSWARITIIDGELSGAIFDGEVLFLVDSSEATFQAMAPEMRAKLDRTQPVIFRARDIRGVLSCGVTGQSVNISSSYQDLIADLNRAFRAKTVKEFTIKINTDSQYESTTSGSVQSNVMSQMNIVDGIFSNQLNIQFNISSITPVSSSGLTTTDSERLLQGYRQYTSPNSTGLAHLFTGKRLDGGSTLGIAYVEAVCDSYGVGVSQAGGRGVAGALTVAHELGHNLGAPHDNESGACRNTSNQYLMNPWHNDKDRFSDCSIAQINRMVDRVSCYVTKPIDGDGGGNNGGDNGGGTGGGNHEDVLTVSKAIFTSNEPIVISYKKSSSNSLDWIGIYKVGDLGSNCSRDNESYIDWRYTGNTSGSASFDQLPKGNYEAQMFSDDGYCFIGKPKPIMVGSFDYVVLALSGLLLLRRRIPKS